ncbi:conserved hypothetical protein [Gammaproteobacteria bacterium]
MLASKAIPKNVEPTVLSGWRQDSLADPERLPRFPDAWSMNASQIDFSLLLDTLKPAMVALVEVYGVAGGVPSGSWSPPPVLVASLSRLFEVLREMEGGFAVGPEGDGARHDLGILGNYGIRLLDEAAGWASDLGQPVLSQAFSSLVLPLACWTGGYGGTLTALKPIVDNLLQLTDQTTSRADSERLFSVMDAILTAVEPAIFLDADSTDSRRAWRILVLNRAMVATRTYQRFLMERAFKTLVYRLPEDAPEFFREGMVQLERLDSPPEARELMFAYCQAWGLPRSLH